jgi:hypothetical protein
MRLALPNRSLLLQSLWYDPTTDLKAESAYELLCAYLLGDVVV